MPTTPTAPPPVSSAVTERHRVRPYPAMALSGSNAALEMVSLAPTQSATSTSALQTQRRTRADVCPITRYSAEAGQQQRTLRIHQLSTSVGVHSPIVVHLVHLLDAVIRCPGLTQQHVLPEHAGVGTNRGDAIVPALSLAESENLQSRRGAK